MKRLFHWLDRWEYTWLCLLLVIILALHFSIIKIPDKTVFDEVHYITDARGVIAGGETVRGEHPPLGKLFVIAGMLIFGDNPFGWRFFSVILGAISIVLFYLVCRNLSLSKRASFLATFLLAFENLTFLFNGMAMLDISCLTFTLAAFWLYLRGNYPLSGIMVALSALAKLNGSLAIIAIALHWIIIRRDKIWEFFGLLIFAPASFVVLMPFFDLYLFHKWTNPIQRISTMLSGSASLTFANVDNSYAQRPWEWIFRIDLTPYTFNPNYLAVVSYTVEFFIIPVVIYMLIKTIGIPKSFWLSIVGLPKKLWQFILKRPRKLQSFMKGQLWGTKLSKTESNEAGMFGLAWLTGTYLMWMLIVYITNRVTYPYYIYQSIGAICIGLGMGLSQLIRIFEVRRTGKLRWVVISFVAIYLLAHIAFFYMMSPLSYWWGTPVYNGVT